MPRRLTPSALALTAALAVLAVLFASTPQSQKRSRSSDLLLETGPDGEVRSGSVEDVMEAVRAGAPIRVGWELTFRLPDAEPETLEHWTDTGFLTLWKGHAFAQIRDIRSQGPDITRAAVHMGTEPHGWVGMLGTDGSLRSVFAGQDPETSTVATRWALAQ